MELLQDASLVALIVTSIAALAYLNKRFDLGLEMSPSDFGMCGKSYREEDRVIANKDREIIDLKQRIEVLEKLVTDPAERLKREIDSL